MVTGSNYRITVLTDRLIRLEYQEAGGFVDQLTKTVVSRDFPEVPYEYRYEDGLLILETDRLKLTYDQKEFSPNGLCIELKDFGYA